MGGHTIAWRAMAVRKPVAESIAELRSFIEGRSGWVIEGCYGNLIESALPWCLELRFLNPGVAACVRNCRARSWEPHKYPSHARQDEMLAMLLSWVAQYEIRDDEFSLARHRAIFDSFCGAKREYGDKPLESMR